MHLIPLPEPHECQVHSVESGGAPPHSKTLARWLRVLEHPPGFGVRPLLRRFGSPRRFRVPVHAKKRPVAPHGPCPLFSPSSLGYWFGAMVGMARCAVPARVAAGGTNVRATLALEGVAPLHAARTSQRDVPTTPSTYFLLTRPSQSQGVKWLIASNHLFRFGQKLLFAALNWACFIAAQGAEVHFTVRDFDTGNPCLAAFT